MPETVAGWLANPQYTEARLGLRPVIEQAAAQYGVPPDVLEYVAGVESRWGAGAGLDQPGAAGELGVFQQTPAFRQDYGVTDPLDTQMAAAAAARALRRFADRADGDWGAALVGYNRGLGGLQHYLSNDRDLSTQPEITARYVQNLEAFREALHGRDPSLGSYSSPVARTLSDHRLPTSVSSGGITPALRASLTPPSAPTEAPGFGGILFDDAPRGEMARGGPLSVAQVDSALRRIDNA